MREIIREAETPRRGRDGGQVMRMRWLVCAVLALFFASSVPLAEAYDTNRSLVRINSGLDGWTTINSLCSLVRCQDLGSLDTLPLSGPAVPSSLFLVLGLPPLSPLTLSLLGVSTVEPDLLLPLKQATVTAQDGLSKRTPISYYGTAPWKAISCTPPAGSSAFPLPPPASRRRAPGSCPR